MNVISHIPYLLAVNTSIATTLLILGVLMMGGAVAFVLRQQRASRQYVVDYQRLRADFTRANERAASFRGEKTQILRIASHEIAEPLAELCDEVTRLTTSVALPEEVAPRVQQIEDLTNKLRRSLSALHEIQALDERSQSLNLGQVNVGAILLEAVAHMSAVAEKKQIRLCLPDPSKTSVALADPSVLRRVIENLIADAVDVTPRDGAVSLSVYQTPDRVLITVADEGPGSAFNDQAQMLSHSGHSRPPSECTERGARLNLAMVHNLIKAMDGWLWSQSEPGGGTTHVVELSLPVVPSDPTKR